MAVIKASRRALFRSVFGRASFELQLEDAHELLMRLSQSLDPIPVTDGMWLSHLANRRRLRYMDREAGSATGVAELARAVDEAVSHARFDDLPPHLIPDLLLLLRVEALLQLWTASSTAAGAGRSAGTEDELRSSLESEIASYVERTQPPGAIPPEVIAQAVSHLAAAVNNHT